MIRISVTLLLVFLFSGCSDRKGKTPNISSRRVVSKAPKVGSDKNEPPTTNPAPIESATLREGSLKPINEEPVAGTSTVSQVSIPASAVQITSPVAVPLQHETLVPSQTRLPRIPASVVKQFPETVMPAPTPAQPSIKAPKPLAPQKASEAGWKKWVKWKAAFDQKTPRADSQSILSAEWNLWQKKQPSGWTHTDADSHGPYNDVWTTTVNREGYVYWWNMDNGVIVNDEPLGAVQAQTRLDELTKSLQAEIKGLTARLVAQNSNAARRAIAALEVLNRDFLQGNDPGYKAEKKIEKLEKLSGTLGRIESHLQFQLQAEDHRKNDHTAPMVFMNVDGTCWLNAVLQLILALPNIRELIETITEAKFKATMKRVISEKDNNEPAAFLWDVLHSLGVDLKYCHGHDSTHGLRAFLKLIPGLESSSMLHESKDGTIPTATESQEYIFVIRDFAVRGVDSTFFCPLKRIINIGGKTREYGMFAVIQGNPGHAVP